MADGEDEQWDLLELPGTEGRGCAAGARDVDAGVPEECAVRGDTAVAGYHGASDVQVLDNGKAGTAEAVQATVLRWRRRDPGQPNLTFSRDSGELNSFSFRFISFPVRLIWIFSALSVVLSTNDVYYYLLLYLIRFTPWSG